MSVQVEVPTVLRTFTAGERSIVGDGQDLQGLIADLETRYPGLSERILEDGKLRKFVNVYLNDEDVRFLDGLGTPLADADVVTILPAVAGG